VGEWEAAKYRSAVASRTFAQLHDWLLAATRPRTLDELGVLTLLAAQLSDAGPLSDWDAVRRVGGTLVRMKLPTRHKWTMLARVLPAATQLQLRKGSIERVVGESNYEHVRAFRRDCRMLFDLAPSTLRLWSGWDPLATRFLDRCGPSCRRRGA